MAEDNKKEKPAKKSPKASRKAKASPRSARTKSETSADRPASHSDKPDNAYEQGMMDASILFQNSSVFGYEHRPNLSDRHPSYSLIGTLTERSTFEHLDRTITAAHQFLSHLNCIIADLDSCYSEIAELEEKSKKNAIEKWEAYLNAYLQEAKNMVLSIEKVLLGIK